MTWVKAHYERVALIGSAMFLLCSVVPIGWKITQFRRTYSGVYPSIARKSVSPIPQEVDLEKASEQLERPAQWTFSGRSGLFVPEKHFIGENGWPATLQSAEIHPPVPNAWLERFGLPITEGDVLNQDPDSDGFSNFEEWQNQTDPKDRNSHPAFITKLKMRSLVQQPFRLVFASWVDDTFAINTNDLKEPTQFLKVGDPIRGTKFKLIQFNEKSERNRFGTKVDVSELTLKNQETGEHVNLVKERIMISPESVANFVYSWGGKREFSVKKDQEFSLKPEERTRYKLVDVQSAKAILINIQKPGEPIEVGLFTP